jgi:tryptophan-rich sensory protein|tara:strand:- start:15125 stop:15442 length:318 start_codon:yes stop_codon:yes gene_type:complete
MAYTGLEDLNDTTLKGILQFPTLDFPYFWPLIMFALFIIIGFSSYFAEKERTGRGNALSSLAVAGFVNIALSTILSILDLIDRTSLIISIVISLIFIAIYLLTDK